MARSDSLWLDSDIILDWLAARQPWDAAATEIIERALGGEWVIWFSPLTLANVYYLYRKHAGATAATAAIQTLSQIGLIATMDFRHVIQAIANGHSDFEDEMQIACATAVPGLTAIITRNLSDYSHSPVAAMTARSWLEQHPDSSQE